MILASCGHQTKTIVELTTKYVTRDMTRALRFGAYCPKCAQELIAAGEVLDGFDEQNFWLNTKELSYHEDY